MLTHTHTSLFTLFTLLLLLHHARTGRDNHYNQDNEDIFSGIERGNFNDMHTMDVNGTSVTVDRSKLNDALYNLMNNPLFKDDQESFGAPLVQTGVLSLKKKKIVIEDEDLPITFNKRGGRNANNQNIRNSKALDVKQYENDSLKDMVSKFETDLNNKGTEWDKQGTSYNTRLYGNHYSSNNPIHQENNHPNRGDQTDRSVITNLDTTRNRNNRTGIKKKIIIDDDSESNIRLPSTIVIKNADKQENLYQPTDKYTPVLNDNKPSFNYNLPTTNDYTTTIIKNTDLDNDKSYLNGSTQLNATNVGKRTAVKKKIEIEDSEENVTIIRRKPNSKINNKVAITPPQNKFSSDKIETKVDTNIKNNDNSSDLNSWYADRLKNQTNLNAKETVPSKFGTKPTYNTGKFSRPINKKTSVNSGTKNATPINSSKYAAKNNFANNRESKFDRSVNKRNDPDSPNRKGSIENRNYSPSFTVKRKTIDRNNESKSNFSNSKNVVRPANKKNTGLTIPAKKDNFKKTNLKEDTNSNSDAKNSLFSKPSNVIKQSPDLVDDNFRKINIVWDMSILKKNLKDMGKEAKYGQIQSLIIKVDNAMKKFISIKNDADVNVRLPSNFSACRTDKTPYFNADYFPEPIWVEADLLIFVYAMNEDTSTLAAASPCKKNEHDRSYVGRMVLNINTLSFEYDDYYSQINEVYTVFHETLHILAFHDYIHSGFSQEVKRGDFPVKFPNLKKMKAIRDDPMEDNGHWNQAYLPTDIMAPYSRIDGMLSIFSMEYLDMVSSEIRTNRSSLPNNFQLDEITDFNDYFTYKCYDFSSVSRYSSFCTQQEMQKDEFGCDRSKNFKTTCSSQPLMNGCYERISHNKYICSNPFTPENDRLRFESYGQNSRCFDGVLKNGSSQSMCLQFEINLNGVMVKALGSSYQCTREGEVITMKQNVTGGFYESKFICPDPNEFKKMFNLTNCPNNCYGNGFCSSGECMCFDGFDKGTDCRTVLNSSSGSSRFVNAVKL